MRVVQNTRLGWWAGFGPLHLWGGVVRPFDPRLGAHHALVLAAHVATVAAVAARNSDPTVAVLAALVNTASRVVSGRACQGVDPATVPTFSVSPIPLGLGVPDYVTGTALDAAVMEVAIGAVLAAGLGYHYGALAVCSSRTGVCGGAAANVVAVCAARSHRRVCARC